MKKKYILMLLMVMLLNCCINYNRSPRKVTEVCKDRIDLLVQRNFTPDSVAIYYKTIKEEIYFPRLNAIVVEIYNSTTTTLDFKKLSTDSYQRFENFSEIEDSLKIEGEVIATEIIKKCDISNLNDIIIEFKKKDTSGFPIYRFICHYNELLEQE